MDTVCQEMRHVSQRSTAWHRRNPTIRAAKAREDRTTAKPGEAATELMKHRTLNIELRTPNLEQEAACFDVQSSALDVRCSFPRQNFTKMIEDDYRSRLRARTRGI